ncbi:MAG: N-acetylneuraminate synthase family protein [Planctomycetes bacterium]|nr:N-acetylneuraminate synthase family protein [Planctomycetota bacterium]
MRIGTRNFRLGDAGRPYIIAELGVNHDGDLARALELTRTANRAGADAIKLQWFEAERLMSKASILAAYQRAAGEQDPIAMLKRLQLPPGEMAEVVALAHQLGLHAIITVFSVELVEAANRIAWDAFKSASPDLIHAPLLAAMAATGKGLIVSTGAAEASEVAEAHTRLARFHEQLAYLQCVSCYPTQPQDASVLALRHIAEITGCPTGYSDHTQGVDTGAYAVSLGAQILEKHLTHDRTAAGPDHAASLDEAGFTEYVRLAKAAVGSPPRPDDPRAGEPNKRVLACERNVRSVSRQSLVTARRLRAGEVLTPADVTIKRPGTGLPPFMLERVMGSKVVRDVDADVPLTEADLG